MLIKWSSRVQDEVDGQGGTCLWSSDRGTGVNGQRSSNGELVVSRESQVELQC